MQAPIGYDRVYRTRQTAPLHFVYPGATPAQTPHYYSGVSLVDPRLEAIPREIPVPVPLLRQNHRTEVEARIFEEEKTLMQRLEAIDKTSQANQMEGIMRNMGVNLDPRYNNFANRMMGRE